MLQHCNITDMAPCLTTWLCLSGLRAYLCLQCLAQRLEWLSLRKPIYCHYTKIPAMLPGHCSFTANFRGAAACLLQSGAHSWLAMQCILVEGQPDQARLFANIAYMLSPVPGSGSLQSPKCLGQGCVVSPATADSALYLQQTLQPRLHLTLRRLSRTLHHGVC